MVLLTVASLVNEPTAPNIRMTFQGILVLIEYHESIVLEQQSRHADFGIMLIITMDMLKKEASRFLKSDAENMCSMDA